MVLGLYCLCKVESEWKALLFDWEAELFNIPKVSRYRLHRPPLIQALVQVKFPLSAQFQTLAGVAPVQAGLEDFLPFMEQVQSHRVSVGLGPGGADSYQSESSVSWRFSNGGNWSLLLEPTAATLSAGSDYQGIDDFADRFSHVLSALTDAAKFRRCDRIGVRYVNIIDLPLGMDREWTKWFRPELTGWSSSSFLEAATELVADINQSQFRAKPVGQFADAPGGVQAIIHYGLIPPGTQVQLNPPRNLDQQSYVLDMDIFIQTGQEFRPDGLLEQLRMLHAQIDSFFRWSLTDEGAAYFGVEEVG